METNDVPPSYDQLDEQFLPLLTMLQEALGGEYRVFPKVKDDYRRIQAIHVAHRTRERVVCIRVKHGLHFSRTNVPSTDIAKIREYLASDAPGILTL